VVGALGARTTSSPAIDIRWLRQRGSLVTRLWLVVWRRCRVPGFCLVGMTISVLATIG
jgi:hypothetical protein